MAHGNYAYVRARAICACSTRRICDDMAALNAMDALAARADNSVPAAGLAELRWEGE